MLFLQGCCANPAIVRDKNERICRCRIHWGVLPRFLRTKEMSLVTKLRDYAARRAQQAKYYQELAQMSDAELDDLGLSHAQIVEMSRMPRKAA